jgi:hypothetical protein
MLPPHEVRDGDHCHRLSREEEHSDGCNRDVIRHLLIFASAIGSAEIARVGREHFAIGTALSASLYHGSQVRQSKGHAVGLTT